MDQVDSYLQYLNEARSKAAGGMGIGGKLAKSGKAFKGEFKPKNVALQLLLIPAVFAAWRTAQSSFSKAARKCGVFRTGQGRKLCIARERLKLTDQKIMILKKAMGACSQKTKDPAKCKQGIQLRINKELEKRDKYRRLVKDFSGATNEAVESAVEPVEELLPFFFTILAGIIIDKAAFTVWRSAGAQFSDAVKLCGTYETGPKREICVARIKLSALQKKLSVIKRIKCNEQKDPKKCKEKIKIEADKLNKKISQLKDDIKVNKWNLKQEGE